MLDFRTQNESSLAGLQQKRNHQDALTMMFEKGSKKQACCGTAVLFSTAVATALALSIRSLVNAEAFCLSLKSSCLTAATVVSRTSLHSTARLREVAVDGIHPPGRQKPPLAWFCYWQQDPGQHLLSCQ